MDAEFIRDLFVEFGPVQVRRMFGGAGLYADGVMFGLVARKVIYLKADDVSIPSFEAEGSKPFGFDTKTRHVLTSYWRLPERLYDDPEELARWAKGALAAAHRKQAAGKNARPATKAAKTAKARKKRL